MTGPGRQETHTDLAERLALALALLWAAGITACFFRGQIAFIPAGGQGANRLVGLWGVFGWLGKGIAWGGAPFPFWPLAGGAAALCLFALLGRLFLRCLDLYVPRSAGWALAGLCGMGIAGMALEPLAIFGWLTTPAVWAVLIIAWLALWRAAYRLQRRPPSDASVADDGRVLRRALREEARKGYEESLLGPRGFAERMFAWAAGLLIGAITLLTFYHAVLYPETYWDSLILYLGYARMTFLEHKFPVKVVAQVGIGLGANYPHLFALLGAATAAMWGCWSPLYQQLTAPMAGLATTVLVYHTALRLTRRVNLGLAAALLFRAIPYGIAYDIWASDYAVAMALAAGFCYLALLYIDTGLWGYLACLTLLTAAGTHLNYLMWAFWGLWALVVLAAHLGAKRAAAALGPDASFAADEKMTGRTEPRFTQAEPRLALGGLLRSGRFWATLAVGIALSLPWAARNWIVCGNPFYPFLSGIFGGKNINPEVLQSAFGEWRANGEGIGVIAAQQYGADTLAFRLRATWLYFVQWQSQWPQFWKLAPVFVGFGLPGLMAWLWGVTSRLARRLRRGNTICGPALFDCPARFGLVLAALLFGHLAYFYLLCDFYLYQILAIAPVIGLLAAYWPLGLAGRAARAIFGLLALAVGAMPGVAVALMGPKLPTDDLLAFRQPLMAQDVFCRKAFPGAAEMWEYVNEHLKGERLLTHENRHLMFDPSITLVHLDDWDIQALYDMKSPGQRAQRLKEMGVHYYLRSPMEAKHAVNRRLGMDGLLAAGRLKEVRRTGDSRGETFILYRIE